MADEISQLEHHRAQFEAGLNGLAAAFRTAAASTDTYLNFVKNIKTLGASDDGDKRGRKRKVGAMDDSDEKPRRQRKPKDPNAPKRPASSYIMFQNDIRKDLKEKNPNITNAELLTLIAKKWSEMGEADKEVYNKAVASAKEQYSNEKKAYDARSPEEVAAANAATEAAIAAKKAQPRGRKSQAAAPPAVAAPAPAAPVTSPSSSSDVSDSEESDEEEPHIKKPLQKVEESDEDTSEEEEEDEEEEVQPPPKKKGKAVHAPPPVAKAGKKRSAK